MASNDYHRHPSKRVNLGEYETEEDILDAIEQSRRITRLIISAVQKGSKFEVSQILEHYGLAMTSRLHFKVTNIVMEQWFSLMGIEDEEQIWNILKKNPYAMNKLGSIASGGTMVLSDMLTEWELGIGALQSKIIRRVISKFTDEDMNKSNGTNNENENDSKESEPTNKDNCPSPPNKDKDTDTVPSQSKETQNTENNENNNESNGNPDSDKKEDK